MRSGLSQKGLSHAAPSPQLLLTPDHTRLHLFTIGYSDYRPNFKSEDGKTVILDEKHLGTRRWFVRGEDDKDTYELLFTENDTNYQVW